ncbi:3-deoxy-D-manno-octulosonic acid kinase [Kangiella sp. TOML190]|uniref:3-deoxy-D-manno-octulosonic acid kinase n=1 Tax=Kangiella sp. TOML190 TaxID=2931351 RepID=UPI00203ECB5A|nr:3-deoxy-D-manno-octulosonic acid kinase [Kangiella sp. TOML190]
MKVVKLNEKEWLVTEKKYRSIVTRDWFDPNYWQQQDAIDGQSLGRGTTYLFSHLNKGYVLRHYRRGGLVGKVIEKSYLFNGIQVTRAYRELKLLKALRKKKLPVPKPVAAFVRVENLRYQAAIVIRLIKNAQDLFHYLRQKPLSEDQWQQVGAMIKQFHEQGLDHADLNIHNIMLNAKGKFWLIDFDKSELIRPNHPRLGKNLQRLLRSLRKEKEKHPDFQWQESDWAALLLGYHEQQ